MPSITLDPTFAKQWEQEVREPHGLSGRSFSIDQEKLDALEAEARHRHQEFLQRKSEAEKSGYGLTMQDSLARQATASLGDEWWYLAAQVADNGKTQLALAWDELCPSYPVQIG